MDNLRRDIAQAALAMKVTFGVRTAIRNVVDDLHEGETVLAMAACEYSGGRGLLVLTDVRVFALRDDLSRYKLQDCPLRAVTAVDYAPQIHDGFAIHAGADKLAVRKIHDDDGRALHVAMLEAIRQAHTSTPEAKLEDAATRQAGAGQELLSRLLDLHSAGIISDAELAAKTAQLLGAAGDDGSPRQSA